MSGRYMTKKRKMRRENTRDIIKKHMQTYADLIDDKYAYDKPTLPHENLTFSNIIHSKRRNERGLSKAAS